MVSVARSQEYLYRYKEKLVASITGRGPAEGELRGNMMRWVRRRGRTETSSWVTLFDQVKYQTERSDVLQLILNQMCFYIQLKVLLKVQSDKKVLVLQAGRPTAGRHSNPVWR